MRKLARDVTALRRAGRLGEVLTAAIDANLDRLSDVLGGAERIAATPIPYAYGVILHRAAYVYAAVVPFAVARAIGLWTIPFAVFVAYTFFALDALDAELEDPFGTEPNDLPLDAICNSIESSTMELAELGPLPERHEPDANFILR